MKRIVAAISVLATVLVACAPATSSSSQSVNPYFDVTVNGQELKHVSGSTSPFQYSRKDFILFLDLGKTETFSGKTAAVEGVRLVLGNQTDSAINIVWNDSTFIDPAGASSRVFHYGVKFFDRNNSLPPTVIAPHARVDDEVFPTDYAEYGTYSGWYDIPVVNMAAVQKTTFRIYLVLQVDGKKTPLDITFKGTNPPTPNSAS